MAKPGEFQAEVKRLEGEGYLTIFEHDWDIHGTLREAFMVRERQGHRNDPESRGLQVLLVMEDAKKVKGWQIFFPYASFEAIIWALSEANKKMKG